jgi:hypothetical protein
LEPPANPGRFNVHINELSIARVRAEAAGMILKLYGTRCSLVE